MNAKTILTTLLCWFAVACSNKENEEMMPSPSGEDMNIGSSSLELMLSWEEGVGYAMKVNAFTQSYTPQAHVCIEVFPVGLQSSKHYEAAYREVKKLGEALMCKATLITDAGSTFEVTDKYSIQNSRVALQLARSITVTKVTGRDHAFNSYVIWHNEQPRQVSDYNYLIPSLVYKDPSNLSETSIGADFTHDWILAREERMGLPLAMLHEKSTGLSVSLVDYNLTPTTFKGEFGAGHFVNAQMQFASLGFSLIHQRPALAYCYPGSEGERTYADGQSYREKRWARRSHPIRTDVKHDYTIELQFAAAMNFPQALEEHWKRAFDLYQPEPLDVKSEDVLRYGLEVLDHYFMVDNGAPGFPFSVWLPDGYVNERSYAMGFVGMQAPCAYYLYRNGLETGNATYRQKGEQILDFWAKNSLNPHHMPRIWWDISPWNHFRDYNDLRNMQGGLEAMISAWTCAEKNNPGNKRNWIEYCCRAADWMLGQQQADGSWYKAFNNAGIPVDKGKFLTSNPIRFLTYMYIATGDQRYKSAVIAAGEFCYHTIHEPYQYVGSVIDNPYVKDRESGQKIIEAFLCLYDLTGEKKWLDGARQAAYYTVTYMYAWNIPVETGDQPFEWPKDKSSVGLTMIATGHSGADCGLSYNSYEFLRLYILTGDKYFLRIAELLEKNTKQTMNYDGNLGYALRGLQTEAIRMVTPRGYGVKLWLPWVTASALDPLFKLKDAYNDVDIMRIASKPLPELKHMDENFRKKDK